MDIKKEIEYIDSKEFKLGEYIYMGMVMFNNHLTCVSVAYKIDYCLKKMLEFKERADCSNSVTTLLRINKVKVGELKKCKEFILIGKNIKTLEL